MTFYFCGQESISSARGNLTFWKCSNCMRGVCGETRYGVPRSGEFKFSYFDKIYPAQASAEAPRYTPESIADDFYEAKTSLQHRNIKSACIMARSAIESAVVNFGATKGGLANKIKELAANHTITQSLADWADEVKEIGNDATHMAERGSAPPTKEDAEDAVQFTEMLLFYLYTVPGMIAERRRKSS